MTPFTPDEIQKSLDLVGGTRAVEIDCDDCLHQVGEFAETYVLGKPVPEGLKALEQHLSICEECREEFDALYRAIKGWFNDGNGTAVQ